MEQERALMEQSLRKNQIQLNEVQNQVLEFEYEYKTHLARHGQAMTQL